MAGPFGWIDFDSGKAAWEAVFHAHGQFLHSQYIEVEVDNIVLDGHCEGCRMENDIFTLGFGITDLDQMGYQDPDVARCSHE